MTKNAGVVDENVKAAGVGHSGEIAVGVGEVDMGVAAVQGGSGGAAFVLAAGADGDRAAFGDQPCRDCPADAAIAPGDESRGM